MSLSVLSLAALPAATGFATQVAQAGQRVGSGFLNVLSQIASPLSDSPSPQSAASATADQAAGTESKRDASLAVSEKTKAWCQRFMSWLSERQPSGDLDIQLSLDSLDGPHITASGEAAEAIDSALAQDPTWLQEFRELALDRVAEQGPRSPGAPPAPPPTLQLTRRHGQTEAEWTSSVDR